MERAQLEQFIPKVAAGMSKKDVIFNMTRQLIESCVSSDDLRLKKTAFTRKRRLGAKNLLRILLQRLVSSLQLGIDAYYDFLQEDPVSKQAFSKARANLNPEYVRKFSDGIAEIHAADPSAPTYAGMRLIAIDGTDIALENSPALKDAFGCSGPGKDAATALGSLAYGPLDHAIYDCQLALYATDERDLAIKHMTRLTELGLTGSLLLFDRWYPSKAFLAHTWNAGFSFVMRVREKWNLEVDRIKTQGKVTLSHDGQTFTIRVLKIRLSSGETETLLTNLNQKQLPIRNAGELYFKRWGIETAYDTLKSKLQMENFSGKSVVSVYQDFYATVYLAGLAAACAEDADEHIAALDEKKQLKYRRKASQNRTISKLREQFWRILLEPCDALRARLLELLCLDIASRPESIRPGRSPLHKLPRCKRFHMAKKAVLP